MYRFFMKLRRQDYLVTGVLIFLDFLMSQLDKPEPDLMHADETVKLIKN